jgi:Ras-related protein Rab-7A
VTGHGWARAVSSLSSAFFHGADAALLIFNVNQPGAMDALVKWWDDFKARAPLMDEDMEDYCCIIVGNKVDVVDNPAIRVSKADALHFLDVLVPSSPDIEEPDTPTQPCASAIAIIPRPPSTPLTQPQFWPSLSSTQFHSQSSSTTSLRSIYNTPSLSLFDQYHSAQASPEGSSSDATVYLTPGSPRQQLASISSKSSGSALMMTPSLFARSRAGDMPTSPLGRPPRPDRYPRLFFTSAKTGEGLDKVFTYIAGRVVKQWEYKAATDVREGSSNAADRI